MPKLRLGLFSAAHLHAYSYADQILQSADICFAGFWDCDHDRGRALAERWNTQFFEKADDLAAADLDGAIVTTENALHHEACVAAASGGVGNILCEKPLSTTPEDARALITDCAERRATVYTAFPCRFSPSFQKAREAVLAGEVGKVIGVRATNRGTCPFGWFVEPSLSGGGAVMDHTVHVADLLRVLLDDDAVEVYAEVGSGMYHHDWDDTGFLTIKFGSGVFATLDTSWSRPPNSFQSWGDVTLEIVGERGVINIDLFAQAYRFYSELAGKMTENGWGSDLDGLMVADFTRACRGSRPVFLASAEDGARAVDIVAGAYRSASSGSAVSLT